MAKLQAVIQKKTEKVEMDMWFYYCHRWSFLRILTEMILASHMGPCLSSIECGTTQDKYLNFKNWEKKILGTLKSFRNRDFCRIFLGYCNVWRVIVRIGNILCKVNAPTAGHVPILVFLNKNLFDRHRNKVFFSNKRYYCNYFLERFEIFFRKNWNTYIYRLYGDFIFLNWHSDILFW